MTEDFLKAVKADDLLTVEKSLNDDPSLISKEVDEGSLLLTAVYNGADKVAHFLAPKLAPIDIYEASAFGDDRRVAEILQSSQELLDSPNRQGFTPLGLAAFFGRKGVVEVLVENGADLERVNPSVNQNTALDSAVAAQQVEVVKLLLSKGANVNVTGTRGYTPLHKAAFAGHRELTQLLLEHGADTTAETDEGRRPRDIAVERGHGEVARLLEERGS